MKQHFNERSKKRKTSDVAESKSFTAEGGEFQVQMNHELVYLKRMMLALVLIFSPKTTSGAQPTLKSVMQSKEVEEKCDLAIA